MFKHHHLKSSFEIILLLFFITVSTSSSLAQSKMQVVQDSVRVLNSEMVIRNNTRNIPGVLFNKGNGVTEFRGIKLEQSGDSTFFIIGTDTTRFQASGGSSVTLDADPDVNLAARKINNSQMKLQWWKSDKDLYTSPRVGIIGDSQGEGGYASSYIQSIIGRLQSFLYAVTSNPGVTNYSKGGYNSRRLSPNGANAYVDEERNVSKALTDGNKIIILCNTSNDFYVNGAGGVMSLAESMANTLLIAEACEKAGATLFVISSFPRDELPSAQRDSLRAMAGLLKQKFGSRCAYVFKLLEDASRPGNLVNGYQIGDNIHLNDAGSNIVFAAIRDVLTSYYGINSNVNRYQLQRKHSFSNSFSHFQYITQPNSPELMLPADSNFYRVRVEFTNGYYSRWSNIIQGSSAFQDSISNQRPLLAVTTPLLINMPTSTAKIVASATDPNSGGGITSYSWQKILGGVVTFSGTNSDTLRLSNLGEGTYAFRCQVVNNAGLTSYADAIVTVRDPSVNVGAAKFNFNQNAQNIQGWIDVSEGPLSSANNNTTWMASNYIGLTNLSNSETKWGTNFYTNSGNALGESIPDEGGFAIPAAVMGSAWYTNTKSYDTSASQMKIIGLNPSKRYKLKFYSSLASNINLDADPTQVIVNKNTLNQRLVNSHANTSKVMVFKGIVPTTQGEIVFFVGSPSGEAVYGMLNALIIEQDSLPVINTPPQVTVDSTKTVQLPIAAVQLKAEAYDADGSLETLTWTQVSGPSGATIANPNSLITSATVQSPGTYLFQCTVKDNFNASSYANQTVIFVPESNNPQFKVGVTRFAYTEAKWKVLVGEPHGSVLQDTLAFEDSILNISTGAFADWVSYGAGFSADASGETNDDGGGFIVPPRVTQGNFFNLNTYNASNPQLIISHLPHGNYKVTVFGSLSSSTASQINMNGNTDFKVNASTVIPVNTTANTSKAAIFNNVSVTDGKIKIYFNPSGGGSIGTLCFFTVEKLPAQ